MGWAAKLNTNSHWNKKRAGQIDHALQSHKLDIANPSSAKVASPISNDSKSVWASIPAKQDEPIVIELTMKNIWNLLCSMLKTPKPLLGHAPTN